MQKIVRLHVDEEEIIGGLGEEGQREHGPRSADKGQTVVTREPGDAVRIVEVPAENGIERSSDSPASAAGVLNCPNAAAAITYL